MAMVMVESAHKAICEALFNEQFHLAWGDLPPDYEDKWLLGEDPPSSDSDLFVETLVHSSAEGKDALSNMCVLVGGEPVYLVVKPLDSWSVGNNLNTARSNLATCGTPTAALSFGGEDSSFLGTTELFNGTTWTATSGLNVARSLLAGCGGVSAALSFGGSNSSGNLDSTEEFDGTTWAVGNALSTPRAGLAGCGTQNSALGFGGFNATSYLELVESYNGSVWSAAPVLTVARGNLGGFGVSGSALAFGGRNSASPNGLGTSESFNGTLWVTRASLSIPRAELGGAGDISQGIGFGGTNGSVLNDTEEWNNQVWSSGGDLNTARRGTAGFGTMISGFAVGGNDGLSALPSVEHYTPGVPFTKTTDYVLFNNQIDWSPAGAEPAVGERYKVHYRRLNFNILELINEVGRRQVTFKAYAFEDPSGTIVAQGRTWSLSSTPTRHLYLQYKFDPGDASDKIIYQLGIFMGTVPTVGNENLQYLIPQQIQDFGTILTIENVEPYPRNPSTREMLEIVITF